MAGLIGRITVGQIVPGSAGAENPKDTVKHHTRFAPRSTAPRFGFGLQKGFQNCPLGIGEVHDPVLDLSLPIDHTLFYLL